MKLEARMTRLEGIVETHLEQSGGIKTDLAWLKRAFWLVGGGVMTGTITLIVGLVLFLIKK